MQSLPSLTQKEKEKYTSVWENPDYRKVAPGEVATKEFLQYLHPFTKITDIGCGTGRAAKVLINNKHFVQGFDIASNCLDPGVDIDLTIGCIWEDEIPESEWGFCTDVMEHIPEKRVPAALANIYKSCRKCYFRIYLHKDNGKFYHEPLHLTVKSESWWLSQLTKYWKNIQMRSNATVVTFVCE